MTPEEYRKFRAAQVMEILSKQPKRSQEEASAQYRMLKEQSSRVPKENGKGAPSQRMMRNSIASPEEASPSPLGKISPEKLGASNHHLRDSQRGRRPQS